MPDIERDMEGAIFASEIVKHMISLSTLVLGISITFHKNIIENRRGNLLLSALCLSWICYWFSIICGVFSLGWILDYAKEPTDSFYSGRSRIWHVLQLLFFLSGSATIVVVGVCSMFGKKDDKLLFDDDFYGHPKPNRKNNCFFENIDFFKDLGFRRPHSKRQGCDNKEGQ